MEFFIKKIATLPVLKLQIIKDGRSDFENIKNSFLTNPVFFSMTEIPTNILKIVFLMIIHLEIMLRNLNLL